MYQFLILVIVIQCSTVIGANLEDEIKGLVAWKNTAEQRQLQLEQEVLELRETGAVLENEVSDLREKVALQDSTSFFSVQFQADTSFAHGSTVTFDKVIVNYGDDYSQSGGIYIVPEDGYYMFTLVLRERGDQHCAGSVIRTPASDPGTETMLCRAEQGHEDYQTSTCTVITELLSGDQVYVIADGAIDGTSNSNYMAEGYTSFTGLLVRAGLE